MESLRRIDPRFDVIRQLGAGGMGIVYEVYDRARDEVVALKTVPSPDAAGFYKFKKEFRTLADVSHPNLVTLYELTAEDDQCYFTMELVRGVDFVSFARRRGELDEGRLRSGLKQLASGLQAVHDAGRLHCDIKPANVLVTTAGRVVILDFGLAKSLVPAIDPRTLETGIHGTLAYLSPEQASEQAPTRASDWYAVGLMLFECLTGRQPFGDNPLRAVVRKTSEAAPSAADLVPGLPEDLVALSSDLLERAPEDRPDGPKVLERLGVDRALEAREPAVQRRRELVGREVEMAKLAEAFVRTRQGRGVSVYVHGLSGMGKTSLVQTFLETRAAPARAVVLAGRCYERELVPYKALDGVVDSLSRYLRRLPDEEVDAYLPPDVGALTRVFPVLGRVESFRDATFYGLEPPDQPTLRRRGFAALRELLRRVAERRGLVVYVDDLQWADAGSIAILEDLLRPPDPPAMLLLASFRREELEPRPFLRDLLARAAAGEDGLEIPLEPLPPNEAAMLASTYLDTGVPVEARLIDNIVRESGGSPFFVEQLAGYVKTSRSTLSNSVSLAEMLSRRIRQLPEGAERVLRTLALAGYPLDASIAHEAAGLTGDERPLAAALRAARLVRSSGSKDRVELYHDRIRETLALSIDVEEARRIHRRLAEALLRRGFDDPETLFDHFLNAGDVEGAARYAGEAASKASEALAFDHAAWFYRRALDLGVAEEHERFDLMRARAEALSKAGRPGDAAEAFLEAARWASEASPSSLGGVTERDVLKCRTRAGWEYLGGGYIEQGLRVVRGVLVVLGFRVPSSPAGKLLSLVWQRLRQRLRGLAFELRDPVEIPGEELLRIDACRTLASNLSTVDPILGLDFQARHVRLALDSGEGVRISRALGIESMMRGMRGAPARRLVTRLCDLTVDLAKRLDDPVLDGMASLNLGMAALLVGRFEPAAEHCDAADETFGERCAGALWEQTFARKNALTALLYLGEIAEIRRRFPLQMAEARDRGNLRGVTDLVTRMYVVWLASDEAARVHDEIDRALEPWKGFLIFHFTSFIGRNEADLYAGDPERAYRRIGETWPDMKRSLLNHSQFMRIEALFARGRTEVAAARANTRAARLEEAARTARRIRREKTEYGMPLAEVLLAGIARSHGDDDRAVRHLHLAVEGFVRNDMRLLAAVARRRIGQLTGGDEGRRAIASADAWMAGQKIENPERMAAMLAPGPRF